MTSDWRELYDMAAVENLHAVTSDHSAIFLRLSGAVMRRSRKNFKFESAWLLDVNCKNVVEASWWQSHALDFQHRIHACGQDLWRWGRDYFRNFGCKIQQLKARLDLLRNSRDSGDVALFHAAEEQLRVLFSQEELY